MKYGGIMFQPVKDTFAVCSKCDLIFHDHVVGAGPVECSKCHFPMKRSVTREEAKKLAYNEYKELFS